MTLELTVTGFRAIQSGEETDVSSRAWIKTEPLAAGVAGTEQTLRRMADFVRRDASDVELRKFAARVVAGCRGHDFEGEIKALYEYVRDKIIYRRDPVSVEMVQDARRTLASGVGDCDDKAVLLATLLGTLGHRSRFCVLAFRDSQPINFQHVYLDVLLKGKGWMPLDPTPERGEFGREAQGKVRRTYQIWPQGGWSPDVAPAGTSNRRPAPIRRPVMKRPGLGDLAAYDPYYTHTYLPDPEPTPTPLPLPVPTPVTLPAPPPSPIPTPPPITMEPMPAYDPLPPVLPKPDPLAQWRRKARKLSRRLGRPILPPAYLPPVVVTPGLPDSNSFYVGSNSNSMNGLEGTPLLQTGIMQAVGAIPVVGGAISTVMSLFGFGGGGGAAKKAQQKLDAYQQQLQEQQQQLEAERAAFAREQKRAGSAKVQARVAVKKAARGKTDEAVEHAQSALILLRGQSAREETAAAQAMAVLQGGGQLPTPGGAVDAYSVPAQSLTQPAAQSTATTRVPQPASGGISPLLLIGGGLLLVAAMSK